MERASPERKETVGIEENRIQSAATDHLKIFFANLMRAGAVKHDATNLFRLVE